MRILITTLCAVLLLFACTTDKKDSGDANITGEDGYVSEGISDVATNREYHLSIQVEGTGYPAADEAIRHALDSLREEFIENAHADTLTPHPYDLQVTSNSFSRPPSTESFLLTIYEYTGGAHGNTFLKSYTVDMKTGELLSLEEALDSYFKDPAKMYETVGSLVTGELIRRFGDNSWVVSGSGTTPENYSKFVLDGDSIRFYFPPYQVASYADGLQVVSLGLNELK